MRRVYLEILFVAIEPGEPKLRGTRENTQGDAFIA
jgi:hypothetical protein